MLVAFLILSCNLQGGLEQVTKGMMIALLVLMLVLAVHSLTFAGAAEGLRLPGAGLFCYRPARWW